MKGLFYQTTLSVLKIHPNHFFCPAHFLGPFSANMWVRNTRAELGWAAQQSWGGVWYPPHTDFNINFSTYPEFLNRNFPEPWFICLVLQMGLPSVAERITNPNLLQPEMGLISFSCASLAGLDRWSLWNKPGHAEPEGRDGLLSF